MAHSNADTSLRHAREIEHGAMRLVYAPQPCEPKLGPFAGHVVEPGWVLLGGERTADPEFARRYAEEASRLALDVSRHSSRRFVQRRK